ncbi:MAG: hypothetical protein EOM87_07735 [Clostridia bacterium]|nr:hypothetical protein [Clostridia bacterium]
MKKALIIVITLLIGAMLFTGCSSNFGGYIYADSDLYTIGGGNIAVEGISKFNINWIAGEVIIESHDGDEIELIEENEGELEEKDRGRYLVKNGILYVKFFAPRNIVNIALNSAVQNKKITIKIPQTLDIEQIDIDVVSAQCMLTDIDADKITVDSVSGDKIFEGVTCDTLIIDSVSGAINVFAAAGDTNINSVSGNIVMQYMAMPAKLEIDSVSGNIEIKLPENEEGFTFKRDSVSGSFNSDFALTWNGSTAKYKTGGSTDIQIDTVSGNVRLTKMI